MRPLAAFVRDACFHCRQPVVADPREITSRPRSAERHRRILSGTCPRTLPRSSRDDDVLLSDSTWIGTTPLRRTGRCSGRRPADRGVVGIAPDASDTRNRPSAPRRALCRNCRCHVAIQAARALVAARPRHHDPAGARECPSSPQPDSPPEVRRSMRTGSACHRRGRRIAVRKSARHDRRALGSLDPQLFASAPEVTSG